MDMVGRNVGGSGGVFAGVATALIISGSPRHSAAMRSASFDAVRSSPTPSSGRLVAGYLPAAGHEVFLVLCRLLLSQN